MPKLLHEQFTVLGVAETTRHTCQSPFSILHPNRDLLWSCLNRSAAQQRCLKVAKDLRNKTMPRGLSGIYVGTSLSLGQHGYLIWVPERHRFVTANHAVFDETYFPARTFRNVYRTSSVLYPLRRTPTLSTHLYVVSLPRSPAILLRRHQLTRTTHMTRTHRPRLYPAYLLTVPIVRGRTMILTTM